MSKFLDQIRANPANPGQSWNPIRYPTNFCLLSGQKSPGFFRIDKGSFKSRWVRQQAPGLAGEFVFYRGEYLTEFTGIVQLNTEVDWTNWWLWSEMFDQPKLPIVGSGKSRSLGWWHPLTQQRKRPVRAVVIEEVDFPKHLGGAQWEIAIQFLEFRTPKFAAAKPEAPTVEKLSPQEQEVADLTKINDALAARRR